MMEIICFLLGTLYAYTQVNLLFVFVAALFFIRPGFRLPLFFLLGIANALLHQWIVMPKGLPDTAVIPHALVQGTVASIPQTGSGKTQFQLALESINNQPAQGQLQLTWYNKAPRIRAGERWQLDVKLKKPRNFHNPGSYNYVNALASRHVFWTGYIHPEKSRRMEAKTSVFSILALRNYLATSLSQAAPNERTAGIVEALTLNITRHIKPAEWDLFRRTGTTHLFGISGEHIALISGLVIFLLRKIWSRCVRCCLRMPAISAASIGGFIIALLYALLAGFAPPVQRALIGCFFYMLYCCGKQAFTPWQVWRYALLGVLLLEPHSVFMQGFYFSFLAVACLFITHQRWRLSGLKEKLALQLSCLLGLMPLSLYWFAYGSFNGFIANMFAIPLVSFAIVPLALITLLFSPFGWDWLLMKPLAWLVALLFKGLMWTEHLAAINIVWPINAVEYVIALLGALLFWAILPARSFRVLSLLWLVLPLFPARTEIKSGEALVQVLDVGQGLAVHVQTQHHTLLYDTGDQFFQGSDLGTMVILPFYQAMGIKTLDAVVISHPDKDHRGGLRSVMAGIPVNTLLVNDPAFYRQGSNCHQTPAWEWDGVQFRFFPIQAKFPGKNNTSCILQVSTAGGRVLFSGDIEKRAEEYLIAAYGEQLRSEVLIVPHHGSKTSSSYRFLLEVAPRYAIASLGFNNRFRFPHVKTLTSMRSLSIPFYRTDDCGMVSVTLPHQGVLKAPQCVV